MKFIPTGMIRTPQEPPEELSDDRDNGKPRHSPSYRETAKSVKSAKKHKASQH